VIKFLGGVLGNIFGSDKAVDNVLDKDKGLLVKAGTAIGNLHFSEQEKQQANLAVAQLSIDRLKALEPFKIVQRIIAFTVMFMAVFVGINVVGAIWYDGLRGCTEAANTCIPVSPAMREFAFSDFVFWPVTSVLTLYILGGVIPKRFRSGEQ